MVITGQPVDDRYGKHLVSDDERIISTQITNTFQSLTRQSLLYPATIQSQHGSTLTIQQIKLNHLSEPIMVPTDL